MIGAVLERPVEIGRREGRDRSSAAGLPRARPRPPPGGQALRGPGCRWSPRTPAASLSRIARRKPSGSRGLTSVVAMPKRGSVWRQQIDAAAIDARPRPTMWLPASISVAMARWSAPWPLAVARPRRRRLRAPRCAPRARPRSDWRCANRCGRRRSRLNSAGRVVGIVGTHRTWSDRSARARAPVAGSGCWPACRLSVSNLGNFGSAIERPRRKAEGRSTGLVRPRPSSLCQPQPCVTCRGDA